MQRTQTQAADSSAVASETGWVLKPGEYEGFVPTPIPTIPFPDWVKPVMPGEPPVIDTRPSQVDLEALAENYIPPNTLYQVTGAEIYHITNSESSALLSSTIVIAMVLKIHPSRWNTPDEKRPANPYDWNHPSYIFTLVDIEVQEVLKGTVKPEEILTLAKNGGQVGEDMLVVENYLAELSEGETLFLYTDPVTIDVPGDYWRINERYTIDPSTNTAANPVETRLLDDLRAEIALFRADQDELADKSRHLTIANGAQLSWYQYNSAQKTMSIDIIFSDGSTLRGSGLTDQNGVSVHPAARNYPTGSWHFVSVNLSPLAGKRVQDIVVAYDNGGNNTLGVLPPLCADLKVFAISRYFRTINHRIS